MQLRSLLSLSLFAFSASAIASTNFDSLNTLSSSEFALLAKDFTAAASYKAVQPGEPLGLTGFDLGVEVTGTQLESKSIWQKAGADISVLPVPKLHLTKGLPADFDIGIFLAAVPNSDIKLIGGELRYALLAGGVALPAISVRATYTQLSGVDQLDLNTKSVEFSASKGFLNLTPYIGIGHVWGDVTANVGGLGSVSLDDNKFFAGLNVNFGLINMAFEGDRIGDNSSLSGKVGFRF